MARIRQQLFQRADPRGYLRAVQKLQRGDVIDVDLAALPAATESEDG